MNKLLFLYSEIMDKNYGYSQNKSNGRDLCLATAQPRIQYFEIESISRIWYLQK